MYFGFVFCDIFAPIWAPITAPKPIDSAGAIKMFPNKKWDITAINEEIVKTNGPIIREEFIEKINKEYKLALRQGWVMWRLFFNPRD